MSDWSACFRLEQGKTYRIRYVRRWEDTVREGTFTFNGEIYPANTAIVNMDPDDRESVPGSIHILSIEEQTARAEVTRAS